MAAAAGHDGPIVRITGDCPFIDPAIVDALITLFEAAHGAAYGSNIQPRSYPDGLDAEVFSPAALARADAVATDATEREHVTTVMRADPERFPAVALVGDAPLARLRWTVDTDDDLAFVRAVVERLGPAGIMRGSTKCSPPSAALPRSRAPTA